MTASRGREKGTVFAGAVAKNDEMRFDRAASEVRPSPLAGEGWGGGYPTTICIPGPPPPTPPRKGEGRRAAFAAAVS